MYFYTLTPDNKPAQIAFRCCNQELYIVQNEKNMEVQLYMVSKLSNETNAIKPFVLNQTISNSVAFKIIPLGNNTAL